MGLTSRRIQLSHGASLRKKYGAYRCIESQLPSIICLTIESEAGLMTRLRKTQEEDDNIVKLRDLVLKDKAQDYVIRGSLLYKDSGGDIQLERERSIPLDTFHIDHLCSLTSTKKSNRYIFAVVDLF